MWLFDGHGAVQGEVDAVKRLLAVRFGDGGDELVSVALEGAGADQAPVGRVDVECGDDFRARGASGFEETADEALGMRALDDLVAGLDAEVFGLGVALEREG